MEFLVIFQKTKQYGKLNPAHEKVKGFVKKNEISHFGAKRREGLDFQAAE
ncbi:MAG: hypothetical protein FWB85_10040 [Chitinispirillia bacterium]|nr:hypothetical protein [Chitinispirillia bacterium]MCL2242537.1 hypothetical protein [Chitinispirillia bacterium]